jgi:hypothetical protein
LKKKNAIRTGICSRCHLLPSAQDDGPATRLIDAHHPRAARPSGRAMAITAPGGDPTTPLMA